MKRSLAFSALLFSLCILLAVALLSQPWTLWAAAACCGLALCLGVLPRSPLRIAARGLLCLALGLLWTSCFELLVLPPLRSLDGETRTVSGVVVESPRVMDYGTQVTLRLTEKGLPPVKMRLICYGEEVDDLICGDRVAVSARLRFPLSERNSSLPPSGIFLRGTAKGEIERQGRSKLWHLYSPQRFGARIRDTVAALYPQDTGPLVSALITGDTIRLRRDSVTLYSLSKAGIYHICAVSGLHVVFLTGLLQAVYKHRPSLPYLKIAAAILLAAMTGFPPSVCRAALLLTAAELAPLMDRETDRVTSLTAALGLLLLLNPWAILHTGLELSFAATLGIYLLTDPLKDRLFHHIPETLPRWLERLLRKLASLVAVTLGAMVFTIPVSALRFGTFSLIAPLSNLLLMLPVNLIFYLSTASALLGMLYLPLGGIAAWVNTRLIRVLLLLCRWLSRADIAVLHVSSPFVVFWVILIYTLSILLLRKRARLRSWALTMTIALSLLALLLIGNSAWYDRLPLSITVLDVGQGQCIVLRDSGFTAIIDCGSDSGGDAGSEAVRLLRRQGENRVDVMILTHFDSDHCNGLDELMAYEELSCLAIPSLDLADSETEEKLRGLAAAYGTPVSEIVQPVIFSLGDSTVMLLPPPDLALKNTGVSVLISSGSYHALVTGDMSASGEKELIKTYDLPELDLFVAGHHGSATSTCDDLLDALRPGIVAISVGAENSYGHPDRRMLDRLRIRSIPVRRTDLEGTLIFTSSEG